jgi:hypothetical protein
MAWVKEGGPLRRAIEGFDSGIGKITECRK